MPIETAVTVALFVLAFALFGSVLAWADIYTRRKKG